MPNTTPSPSIPNISTYTLTLAHPKSHLLEISLRFPISSPQDTVRVSMPCWSPGSYLMREYGRHVQDVSVSWHAQPTSSASPLPVRKVTKETWEIDLPHGETGTAEVRYRIYAHELSVRYCHYDTSHAFIHGPAAFMFVEGRESHPCHLTVDVQHDPWTIFTTLPREDQSTEYAQGQGTFVAESFDELVDCPLEIGPHALHRFTACGVPHDVVFWGPHQATISDFLSDLARTVESAQKLFAPVSGENNLPYTRYLFIILGTDTLRGGLEHRDSTALMIPYHAYSTKLGYEDALTLCSHEHFHVWNVKRIRPKVLGPFDYCSEAYTRALWVMEGFTCYYENIILLRAGLMTQERFLELLGQRLGQAKQIPGRRVRSVEEASFDAWVKLYRPHESNINTTISYYLKGELVAWLLDLHIRAQTSGAKSLDDVMLRLWSDFLKTGEGFDENNLQTIMEEASGCDLDDFFNRYVRGAQDLDPSAFLAPFGLTIQGSRKSGTPDVWLGTHHKSVGDRLVLTAVLTNSPAERAGLSPGDELVALNGFKLNSKRWDKLLGTLHPGSVVDLHIFRRGRLVELKDVIFTSPPENVFSIQHADNADSDALQLRTGWLGA